MTKLQTLLAGAVAGAAVLSISATAGAVILTPTSTEQTYTTLSNGTTITFSYDAVAPEKILAYTLAAGGTPVGFADIMVSGAGTYTVPLTLDSGITVGYELAVPEPAAWAMMLVGFGGIGAAMRRRGPKAAASAA